MTENTSGPPVGDVVPKVSVCLLTYNHETVVEDAVRSVLAQTFADFELILSDDCSTDGTFTKLRDLAAQDGRVRVLRTPTNLGMAGNANFAAEHARGAYIALLHHDDICRPTLLDRWVAVMDRHASVGFVSNTYGRFNSSLIDDHPFAEFNRGVDILRRHMLARWGCPIRGTALIRASSWRELGGMRLQFGMLADVDLWMRLAAKYDVGYVNEPLILVRHDRPSDYPQDYVKWSWRRLRTVHAIHGANHLEHYGTGDLAGTLRQKWYRARVNYDIARWLTYALVRRKTAMVVESAEVASDFEYRLVRALRNGLIRIARARSSADPRN